MNETLQDLKLQRATSVVADICCSPVPNEASSRLHLAHGFELTESSTTVEREFPDIGLVTIEFNRYSKNLTEIS